VNRLAAALPPIGAALGQISLADGVAEARNGQAPILRFHANSTNPAYGSVDLQHLGSEVIRQLWHADPSIAQWQQAFPVCVDDAEWPGSDAGPPVLGRYELLPDGVRFTPRYPLMKSLKYRASADLSALLGELEHSAPSRSRMAGRVRLLRANANHAHNLRPPDRRGPPQLASLHEFSASDSGTVLMASPFRVRVPIDPGIPVEPR
jgi:hypothetical protein